jgi:hypothetical protein
VSLKQSRRTSRREDFPDASEFPLVLIVRLSSEPIAFPGCMNQQGAANKKQDASTKERNDFSVAKEHITMFVLNRAQTCACTKT